MEDHNISEYHLRWNNHHTTLVKVLDMLLQQESLVDVTLAAEGKFVKVHKVVLCACSTYFKELLCQQSDKQTIIFLKDVSFDQLQAVVDYMYRGEVNVSYEQLPLFLSTAEALKIEGLTEQCKGLKQTKKMAQNQNSPALKASPVTVPKPGNTSVDRDASAPAPSPAFVSCQTAEGRGYSSSENEPESNKDDLNSLDCFEVLEPKIEPPEHGDSLTTAEETGWSDNDVGQVSLTGTLKSTNPAVMTHLEEGNGEITLRRFVCPTCPKSYKNRADMRKHTKYECGKEPRFICPTCGSKFGRSYHLHRHLRQVHCASI